MTDCPICGSKDIQYNTLTAECDKCKIVKKRLNDEYERILDKLDILNQRAFEIENELRIINAFRTNKMKEESKNGISQA